jgi:CheY-like chemotaxis protein
MNLKKRILIVDDDPVSRKINKRIIELLLVDKVVMYEAADGQQALDVVNSIYLNETVLPDLVLLDLYMNVMSAFEFIRNFQNLSYLNKEGMCVVVISSSDNLQDMVDAESLGVKKILIKPLTAEKLGLVILENLVFD